MSQFLLAVIEMHETMNHKQAAMVLSGSLMRHHHEQTDFTSLLPVQLKRA